MNNHGRRLESPRSRRSRWALLLAALALFAGACGSNDDDDDVAADDVVAPDTSAAVNPGEVGDSEVDKLRLVWTSQAMLYAPLVIAQDQGYFDANGLELELVDINTAAGGIAAVASGDGDVNTNAPTGVLQAMAAGAPFTIIAQWGQSTGYDLAVSKDFADEHGITESTSTGDVLRALEGGSIGSSPPGGGLHHQAMAAIRAVGLEPDSDITYVPLGSGSANVAALEQGTIDAFLFVAPITTMAQTEQGALIFPLSDLASESQVFGDAFDNVMYATADFVAEAPNALTKLINGYYCGVQYALENPEDAFAITEQAFAGADRANFDRIIEASDAGPVPAEAGFEGVLEILNLADVADGGQIDLAYEDVVDPTLAEAAKDMGCASV